MVFQNLLCKVNFVCCVICLFRAISCSVVEIPIGVPMLSEAGTPYDIERVGPAIDLAIVKVNNEILNENYKLKKVQRNYGNECSNSKAPGVVADMYREKNIAALIGPACAYALDPVAKMANHWNIPIVTGLGDGGQFKDKTDFPTLTRFAYCQCRLRKVFGSIFQEFQWESIAIIYDQNDVHSDVLGTTLQTGLQKQDIYPKMFPYYGNQMPDYKLLLKNVKSVSRVVLLIVPGDSLREILLTALDLGYIGNGEFVFFDVLLFPFPGEYWGNHDWRRGDSRDTDAKKAYEALLRISLQVPESEEWKNFTKAVKEIALRDYHFDYQDEEINFFVGAFHDAVVLYGIAVNETISAGGNYMDGYNLTRTMWNRTFQGVSGDVDIDDNGDRDTSYSILDMDPVTGKFHVVANYWGHSPGYTPVVGRVIHWAGGGTRAPTDVPYCGYSGELERCKLKPEDAFTPVHAAIVVSLTLVLLILGVVAALLYRRYKWERDLQDMSWRVNYEDISFFTTDATRSLMSLYDLRTNCSAIVCQSKQSVQSSLLQLSIPVAVYKGNRVFLTFSKKTKVELSREVLIELKQMQGMQHNNLTRFIGACVEFRKICTLTEFCGKGTLEDVLNNENIQLDWTFRISLLKDVARGMVYIHNSDIGSHGNLGSWNCVVDSRFVVKVTGFGLYSFWGQGEEQEDVSYHRVLSTAPEFLRGAKPKYGSTKGDVYSFSIIMEEVITRAPPFDYYRLSMETKEIVERIRKGENPPFRPKIERKTCSMKFYHLILRSWAEIPEDRPSMGDVLNTLKQEDSSGNKSLMDTLLSRMERYASNLEDVVEERTQQLLTEKKRSEELLHQILPRSVADKLRMGEIVDPEYYDMVTIYFSDIVDFTELSSLSTPLEIVSMLNDLYTLFDNVIEGYDVYKVETIGDAYMVVSGLPIRNGNQHVVEICSMACCLLDRVSSFVIQHRPTEKLRLRIGIHSGSCVSGVVGHKMPRYCLFGDTVNVASRMESTGEALRIHISDVTKTLLEGVEKPKYRTESRGPVHVKGKGEMNTYFLENDTIPSSKTKILPTKTMMLPTETEILPTETEMLPTEMLPNETEMLPTEMLPTEMLPNETEMLSEPGLSN